VVCDRVGRANAFNCDLGTDGSWAAGDHVSDWSMEAESNGVSLVIESEDETPFKEAYTEMIKETRITLDHVFYISEYEHADIIHYLFESTTSLPKESQPRNEIVECQWFTLQELTSRNVSASVRPLLKLWMDDSA
jgi:hypothetical protein